MYGGDRESNPASCAGCTMLTLHHAPIDDAEWLDSNQRPLPCSRALYQLSYTHADQIAPMPLL